eukprot:2882054-Rhodomonas_salina.2
MTTVDCFRARMREFKKAPDQSFEALPRGGVETLAHSAVGYLDSFDGPVSAGPVRQLRGLCHVPSIISDMHRNLCTHRSKATCAKSAFLLRSSKPLSLSAPTAGRSRTAHRVRMSATGACWSACVRVGMCMCMHLRCA